MTNNYWFKVLTMPLWGAALLMFLPAIGFVLVGQELWKKVRNG